jgi:DNA-binding transcriptional ArsR family regulator
VTGDTTRLRRYITDESGNCCETDIEARLEDLNSLVGSIPEEYANDLTALKTLGNETRYRIIRLLAAADDELCVCEITPLFEVSESAVSHALSDLTDSGLLSRRKEGKWRHYRTTARAERLVEALDETREDDE